MTFRFVDAVEAVSIIEHLPEKFPPVTVLETAMARKKILEP